MDQAAQNQNQPTRRAPEAPATHFAATLRAAANRSTAAAIAALVDAQRLADIAERDELRAQAAEMRLLRGRS